jgi:hypothetical protein
MPFELDDVELEFLASDVLPVYLERMNFGRAEMRDTGQWTLASVFEEQATQAAKLRERLKRAPKVRPATAGRN